MGRQRGFFATVRKIALWIFLAGLAYGILKIFNFDLIAIGTTVWDWLYSLVTGIGDKTAESESFKSLVQG